MSVATFNTHLNPYPNLPPPPHQPLAPPTLSPTPAQALCRMSVAFMRASMIIGRVNLSTELFPGVIAPALILPTIGACTGALFPQLVMLTNNWSQLLLCMV